MCVIKLIRLDFSSWTSSRSKASGCITSLAFSRVPALTIFIDAISLFSLFAAHVLRTHLSDFSFLSSNRWSMKWATHFGSWCVCYRSNEAQYFSWISILALWQLIRGELSLWWTLFVGQCLPFVFCFITVHTFCRLRLF